MMAITLSVIAIVVSVVAAAFACYQAVLVRRQIQLQAILDLDREWRSPEMRKRRASFWTEAGHPDENRAEEVLEFLEKVSSFEERGIIQAHLIWDTLGWYMVRYHHYSTNVIEVLRDRWTLKPDPTLYQDLQKLSAKLLHEEAVTRKVNEDEVRKELDDEERRRKFIDSERACIHA